MTNRLAPLLALVVWLAWPASVRAQGCCSSDDVPGNAGDKLTATDKNGTKKAEAKVTIKIQIAPLARPGDGVTSRNEPADSEFSDLEGDVPNGGFANFEDEHKFINDNLAKVQKAMFKRIGISPCDTEPEAVKDAAGAQDFLDNSTSEVLNNGGSRTAFGYFIRFKYRRNDEITTNGHYFALFSYDKIKFKEASKPPLCATEFFLFDNGSSIVTPLELGLAIAKDGSRLTEVPTDLARVRNFLPQHARDEAVKPGIAKGEGCMLCHGGVPGHPIDQTPQHTLPFPWKSR